MGYKNIHNANIQEETLTSLTDILYLSFENCTFYNVFHHIYNLTNLISLQLINCDIAKDVKQNELITLRINDDITDDIIKLVHLKSLTISTNSTVHISKRVFEMNLTTIILSKNIIIPDDVIYYNLMNYESFYINDSTRTDDYIYGIQTSKYYQNKDMMLIIIKTNTEDIDIDIPEYITKINVIFTSEQYYNYHIQNIFDNLPMRLLELKIINPNRNLTLTNMPPMLEKIYFLWTQYTRGWRLKNKIRIFDNIISNSKLPLSTEIIIQ
jgi:hypothetical protein